MISKTFIINVRGLDYWFNPLFLFYYIMEENLYTLDIILGIEPSDDLEISNDDPNEE